MIDLNDDVYLFCKKNNLTPVWVETDGGIGFWVGVSATWETDYRRANPPFAMDEEPIGQVAVLSSNIAYCLENDSCLPYKEFEQFELTPYMVEFIKHELEHYTKPSV